MNYTGFYAEAAASMRAYWTALDQRYAGTDTHVGSFYGAHHIWTDDFLDDCRTLMENGRELAKSDRVREAVEMTAAGGIYEHQKHTQGRRECNRRPLFLR